MDGSMSQRMNFKNTEFLTLTNFRKILIQNTKSINKSSPIGLEEKDYDLSYLFKATEKLKFIEMLRYCTLMIFEKFWTNSPFVIVIVLLIFFTECFLISFH